MVLDRPIQARRQRGKRWKRIYSDGARGSGSLREAHSGNDARLMCCPGEDPFAGVCTSQQEYERALAFKAARRAQARANAGLDPEVPQPSDGGRWWR